MVGTARTWTVADDESGQPLLEFDAFLGLDYAQDAKVPQQPIEQGSFAAYNKVGSPYLVKVTLAKNGNASTLKAFADALEGLTRGMRLVRARLPLGKCYKPALAAHHRDRRRSAYRRVGP